MLQRCETDSQEAYEAVIDVSAGSVVLDRVQLCAMQVTRENNQTTSL